MLLSLSLDRMRRLVAMLLLCGVFLAGSVEAVACEPLFEETSHAVATTDDLGGEQSDPGTEKHGLCSHGHCHHSVQFVQADAGLDIVPFATTEYRTELAGPLHSSPHHNLKRPPRP